MPKRINPFQELETMLQEIDHDIKDLKDCALRVHELASKLVQLDPTDKTAQDALELAKQMLSR
jgi:hypothetical protein